MKFQSIASSLGIIFLASCYIANNVAESQSVVEEVGNKQVVNVSSTTTTTAYNKNTCDPGPHDVPNPSPEPDTQAPDHFYFQIPTTVHPDLDDDAGLIIFEVNRTWAPIGVDRFYSLTKDNYYDCAAFFRVVPNFVVQLGIASIPEETEKWNTNIADDPVLESNTVGMVSFATAGPGTRTTQIFINTVDNVGLDKQGFAPFAKVVKGMDILTTSGAMYVPSPVPDQGTYEDEGNVWILQEYPEIDIIKGLSQKIELTMNDGDEETTEEQPTNENENDITTTAEDKTEPTNDNNNNDVNENDTNDSSSAAAAASTSTMCAIVIISSFIAAFM